MEHGFMELRGRKQLKGRGPEATIQMLSLSFLAISCQLASDSTCIDCPTNGAKLPGSEQTNVWLWLQIRRPVIHILFKPRLM